MSLTIDAPAATASLATTAVARVDAHDEVRARGAQPFDDRQDTLQLFVGGDRRRTRTGRLPAHVDDVGAVVRHTGAVRDRAAASANRPPSLKESGVTFTTPITSVRAPSANAWSRHRQIRSLTPPS